MNKKLQQQKEKYQRIPIPAELDIIVKQALQQKPKRKKRRWLIPVAASVTLFVGGLNVQPAFAHALSDVPVVGGLFQLLTFTEYKIEEEGFQADIKVPALSLNNKELESALNKKYIEESKEKYEEFMEEMNGMKAVGTEGYVGLESDYRVITDTDKLFTIERYVIETRASSVETLHYDTIDKENELLLTLPSLFKDGRYIEMISNNIKAQMKAEMKENPNKMYWIEDAVEDHPVDTFQTIAPDQNFYITEEGKLVISFNEYEVAPGFMGAVEFVIPTDVIKDVLISDEYIH